MDCIWFVAIGLGYYSGGGEIVVLGGNESNLYFLLKISESYQTLYSQLKSRSLIKHHLTKPW